MKYWMILVMLVQGCGTPAAKTALDIIAPIAADALTALISDRYGSEPDEATAACFPLPDDFTADDGYVYAMCRAKPVGGD